MINKEYFILHNGPISSEILAEIIISKDQDNVGANSIFLGKIRADAFEDKRVREIEYSAYFPMLVPVIDDIVKFVFDKYNDLTDIKIIHSTGTVKVGEIALLVFVACGHRTQSFKAVEEIVELIKEKLPVWKKEIFEDDTYTWPNNQK